MVRVAVLDREQSPYKLLHDLSLPGETVEVVGFVSPEQEVQPQLEALQPDLLLLNGDDESLDAIGCVEKVTLANLPVACVMLWETEDTKRIRHAMRAGAEDFLIKPLAEEHVVTVCDETLAMVRERWPQGWGGDATVGETAAAGHYCQVTGIVCAKSGVGKTTLAVNLAILLAKEQGRRTALVDLQSGYAAVLLNMQPKRGLKELAELQDELDLDVLQAAGTQHESGLDLYTWQLQPDFRQSAQLNPEFLQVALQLLAGAYDHIFCLFPKLGGERSLTALSIMDDLLLITTGADLLTLRDTRIFLDTIEDEFIEKDKIKLILNRFDKAKGFSQDDVSRTLHRPLTAVLPSDHAVTASSINLGIPFVMNQPKTDLAQSLRSLLTTLTGSEAPAAEEPAGGFRLFGRR